MVLEIEVQISKSGKQKEHLFFLLFFPDMEKVTIDECSTIAELLKAQLQDFKAFAGYRPLGTPKEPQCEFTLKQRSDLDKACVEVLGLLRNLKRSTLSQDWGKRSG